MERLKNSMCFRLLVSLAALWQDSAVAHLLQRLEDFCSKQISESFSANLIFGESSFSRKFDESFLARFLTTLGSLPGTILHFFYRLWENVFEDSFFARLAFSICKERITVLSYLLMLIWVIPYERWNNAFSMMVAVLVLILFYGHAMQTGKQLNIRRIGFYPLVLFGCMFLSTLLSFARTTSLRFLLYHIAAGLLVLVVVSCVENWEDLQRLLLTAAFCVFVSGGYGVIQRIQGVEVNKSYVDLTLNADMPGRVYSFFDNPNTFAQVMMLLLPLIVALILASRSWLLKFFGLVSFTIGVAALAMTYSRASWLGFATFAIVFIFLWEPRLLPLFFILCVMAIPLLPSTIFNRILTMTNMKDSSTSSRWSLWAAALKVIALEPLKGAGLGTTTVQSFIKAFNLYRERAPYVHSHNFYLELYVETGLLGLLAFLSSLLMQIKRTAHAARHGIKSPIRIVAAASGASICGAMVCGMADYLWNYPRVMCIFWFVFAVGLAAASLTPHREDIVHR